MREPTFFSVTCLKKSGRPDILVNNAALQRTHESIEERPVWTPLIPSTMPQEKGT